MIMVTGSTGFVGRHLVRTIASSEKEVVAVYRSGPELEWSGTSFIKPCKVDSLDSDTNWAPALDGVETVIHCAALAHGNAGDGWATNVEGTRALAEQAAKKGVKRLVFLSSIAVYGSSPDGVLRENQELLADSEYGRQKLEAEKVLHGVAKSTGLEIVVVRPPLIYGDGAPGNFGLLRRIVGKGIPLPLASIDNRRSFLSVLNLVDFILLCANHTEAKGNAFVVCDDETVSTSQFLKLVGDAIGRQARLFWLPSSVVYGLAKLTGKAHVYGQLYGSLEIEMSRAKTVLEWRPPFSIKESLTRSFSAGVY